MNNDHLRPRKEHLPLFSKENRTVLTVEEGAITILNGLSQWVANNPFAERPGLMLSGGIDSLVLAAFFSEANPHCFTIADRESEDWARSSLVCEQFNLEHTLFEPVEFLDLTSTVSSLLGTKELWSITAAVPLKAAFNFFTNAGITGNVLTGGGADVAFLGGMTNEGAIAQQQTARAESYFKHPIPDYYDRILGTDVKRLIEPFFTREMWALGGSLSAEALWVEKDGETYDKAALRLAGEMLGLPKRLAWTKKDPLQKSSGLIKALETEARLWMIRQPLAETYADVLEESPEEALARLWLLAKENISN